MEPTDEQYMNFGAAVSGIMDVYVRERANPERILEIIQIAASTTGIELGVRS